jgi:hypothetical protein
VLRTSRFFPEPDDDRAVRNAYDDDNAKINEFLHRRVDIEDVVAAHLLAIEKAPVLGFDRFIISATSPFSVADLHDLRSDTPSVVRRYAPRYAGEYARRGWSMVPGIPAPCFADGAAQLSRCGAPPLGLPSGAHSGGSCYVHHLDPRARIRRSVMVDLGIKQMGYADE